MKIGRILLFTAFFICLVMTTKAGVENFPTLKGPYLGQKPPGKKAEVFAPGIVSTKNNEVSNRSGNRDIYWVDARIIEELRIRRSL